MSLPSLDSAPPLEAVFAQRSLAKSKSPRYREAIYQAIKEAILAGRLMPNQPLIEEQLAASLDVSRTPVREALALLEHEEFIAPRNGRGLYVRAVTFVEFMEMFIANEAVEPYLARRAARQADAAQIKAIGAAVDAAQACADAGDMAGFLRNSRTFHRLVGEAADNRPLAEFVVRNEERTDMYLLNYEKVLSYPSMVASVQEHRAILEALAARDPEAAERLVIYHAQSLRTRLTELFNADTEAGPADNPASDADPTAAPAGG